MEELIAFLNSIYPLSESTIAYLEEHLQVIGGWQEEIYTKAGKDLL